MFPGHNPAYLSDDTWLRPVVPSPHGSPNMKPMYLDDNFNYYQPGSGYIGVPMLPTGFIPLPPSPSMLAAGFVPLPPSPHVSPRPSPRLGPIPLGPPSPIVPQYQYPHYPQYPQYAQQHQYYYPIDPWYLPQGELLIPLSRRARLLKNVSAGPMYMNPQYTPRSHIHPLLKDAPGWVYLNLAAPAYKPLTPKDGSNKSLISVHNGYLHQVACYPAATKMIISCDGLHPFADSWKIVIEPGRHINVGDVLHGIHTALQTPVNHEEWSRLNSFQRYDPSKAYTKRVEGADYERVQGVRRVDFLGEKHWFAGITRVKDDSKLFKLHVRAG